MIKHLCARLCVTVLALTLCLALRPAAARADEPVAVQLDASVLNDNTIMSGEGWTRKTYSSSTAKPVVTLLAGYSFVINGVVDNNISIENSGTVSSGSFECRVINRGTMTGCTFNGSVSNHAAIEDSILAYTASGTYTNCTFSNGNTAEYPDGILYSNATYNGCTFEDKAHFNGCTLNGCRFASDVTFSGDSETTVTGCTFSGGTVDSHWGSIYCELSPPAWNYDNRAASYATFNNLEGSIYGGAFHNTVNNNYSIGGGTFHSVVNNNNTIGGGTFHGDVNNKPSGTISGGTFLGDVHNSGKILGGTFRGAITNEGAGTVERTACKFGIKLELTNLTVTDQTVDGDWLDAPGYKHYTFTLASTDPALALPGFINITTAGNPINQSGYTYNYQTGVVMIAGANITETSNLVVTAAAGASELESVTLSTDAPIAGNAIVATVAPKGAKASYQWFCTDQAGSTMGGIPITGATNSSYTPDVSVAGKYLYVVATGASGMTGRVKAAAASAVLDASYTISITPASFDFGAVDEHYLFRPRKQTVTVKNTGNAAVSLLAPTAPTGYELITSSNWGAAFVPGASRSFTVQPLHGLAAGSYSNAVTIETTHGSSAAFTPSLTVNAGPVNHYGTIELDISELNDTSKTSGTGWVRTKFAYGATQRAGVVLAENNTFHITNVNNEKLRCAVENRGTLINSTVTGGSGSLILNTGTVTDCSFTCSFRNQGMVTGSTLNNGVNNYGTVDNCFCASYVNNRDGGTVSNCVMNNALRATADYDGASVYYTGGTFSNCTFESPFEMQSCTVNDSVFTIGASVLDFSCATDSTFNNCSIAGDSFDCTGMINGGVYDCYLGVSSSSYNTVAPGITGGTFRNGVNLGQGCTVTGGTFLKCDLPSTNLGTISGGTFYCDVTNYGGTISGGTFYGALVHRNSINGGYGSSDIYYKFYPERCQFGVKTALKTDMHTIPAANDGWLLAQGGRDFTFQLVSNFGDILPRFITVTKAGKALKLHEAYTYNSQTGEVTIFSKYITAGDLVVSAVLPRGRITGTVQNDASPAAPIAGVTVNVYHGENSPCDACVTNELGEFEFQQIPYGVYSIVGTWTDVNGVHRTATQILKVDAESVTGALIIPVQPLNTLVEIDGDLAVAASGLLEQKNAVASEENAGITQEDLATLGSGGSAKLDLSLAAGELTGTEAKEDKATIEATLDTGESVALLVDLTVKKQVTNSAGATDDPVTLTSLQQFIDIYVELPDNLIGLPQLTVKRIHDGEVQTLPLGAAGSVSECYYIEDTNAVLHVKQFSTYALAGPGDPVAPAVEAADAGGSGGDVPKTGDRAMPMLWTVLALVSGAGFATCLRRRKQNG